MSAIANSGRIWWSKDSCRVMSDFRAYTVPHGGRIRDNVSFEASYVDKQACRTWRNNPDGL